MNTYKTAQVAKAVGVHPNTVRLYEDLGLIPKPKRGANGYRIFSDQHIEVLRLARVAFQIEVVQNGLRKKIVNTVKTAAAGDYVKALAMTDEYLSMVQSEQEKAKEAIGLVKQILAGKPTANTLRLKRSETAAYLRITIDTLRNWEMNGLLTVKRTENGYRIYTGEDIDRLKIIYSLRCANYSLEAILRMLSALSVNPHVDIERALDTPIPDDDMLLSVYDKLLTSLSRAEQNAKIMQEMLREMKQKY